MLEQFSEIEVLVKRGRFDESRHSVTAAVVDSGGTILKSFGQSDLMLYPRSSIKPLQAMPIVISGAKDRFQITSEELALACASHNGEAEHVRLVSAWLSRLGLSTSDLECGVHAPAYAKSNEELLRKNASASALHNNCSGKHTGMLAVALALGTDTKSYVKFSHPVQSLIRKTIEDFCDVKISEDSSAIDGCSIPTYYLPILNLALGMARFVDAESLNPKYRTAATDVYSAMTKHPFLVAGTDRYCTKMMSLLSGGAAVKTGAEGVMFAAVPKLKVGIVVKTRDGATRAAEAATTWLLHELGVLDTEKYRDLQQTPIKNWNGIQTGSICVKA